MVYCECIGSDIVLCTFCIVKQTWQDCYESEKSAPNPWLLSDQWLTIVHPWVTFIQIISGHWCILVLFAESHSCQLWAVDSEAWLKLRTGLPSRMCNRDGPSSFSYTLCLKQAPADTTAASRLPPHLSSATRSRCDSLDESLTSWVSVCSSVK